MPLGFAKAYAKINLTLDVVGKREDGYHELDMIMQSVSLFDSISVRTGCGGEGISVKSNARHIPNDDRNIAVKAAKAFLEHTGMKNDGIAIVIEKRIPSCAGLAGGSADGAAVIRLLDELYETALPFEKLAEIGAAVGSDVPFCLMGGTARARGRGERLLKLPDMPECFIVLCKPRAGMSTKSVFGGLDLAAIEKRPDTEAVISAIERGSLCEIASGVNNTLEGVVSAQCPEIQKIKTSLLQNGAIAAAMTGSGSTVFGIFDSEELAKRGYGAMRLCYDDAYLTRPISY